MHKQDMGNADRARLRPWSLGSLIWLMGVIVALGSQPGQAKSVEPVTMTPPHRLAQTQPVTITDVRLETAGTGLQLVLETAGQELLAPIILESGNVLSLEIPNAVLIGESFEQVDPAEGIAAVTVSALGENRVQVAITGTDAVPTADVSGDGLTLNVVPAIVQVDAADEALRIVVTGDENEGYSPSNSSTATGTDTPLRDVPLSIQVIPRAVLDDRNVTELRDALELAGGVSAETGRGTSGTGPFFRTRGFGTGIFRDGIVDFSLASLSTNDVERVEVLKGPASVLFGQGAPGGIINVVSKRPLGEPFYEFSVTAGSFDTYRGAFDLSGPLNDDNSVRYRLNASYENYDSFRDFVNGERLLISPIVTWDMGSNTSLDVYGRYIYDRETIDEGIPFTKDGEPFDIPRSRFLGEEFGDFTQDQFSLGYRLNHGLSENWSLRHSSQYLYADPERIYPFILSLDDATGDFERLGSFSGGTYERFFTNAEVRGNFNTGSIEHQLLFGIEYRYDEQDPQFRFDDFLPPRNVFNPVYLDELYDITPTFFRDDNAHNISVYVQDQIDITPELKALAGVRFDYVDQFRTAQFLDDPKEVFEQTDEAFSPRFGLVYQPLEPLSLYASYTTSFEPAFGVNRNSDGSAFDPEEGRQFEVGVKADLSDQLALTLAAFDIRRQNVATAAPTATDPFFEAQTGEVTSRGIELNLNGEILPGWNITTNYTYLDAFVSKDNTDIEGNRLDVPENQLSLWTTYEIQRGDLAGLGAGLGFFYVDEQPANLSNTFTLPNYFRTDAALFYNRDNWQAQLNFENLFDIDYFPSANFGLRETVNVGKPFSVSASFSIEF